MNRRQPADDGIVFHDHVSRQGRHIGHDDVIAEPHVVCDVGVSQDMVVRADSRGLAISGSAVDRHVLPKGVAIGDLGAGEAAFPLQVLRLQPDAGERENLILAAQHRMPIDDHVRVQATTRPEHDLRANDAVRANHAACANLCLGMNHGGGMDLGHLSMSMKVTSASLTGSESTEQTPLARPIFPRALVSSTSISIVSPGRTGLRHFTLSAAMK